MAQEQAPFDSFVFNLTDQANGRVLFSLVRQEGNGYELHVEKGPVGSLAADFTRSVPLKTAEALRDACADLGVFGWDEEYSDSADPGSQRWSLAIVFKEGVFSQRCQGGSSVPEGFDGLLEQLYQMDLPRPGADDAPMVSVAPTGISDLGALFGSGVAGGAGGPEADMLAAMQETMNELTANPERFQQQLKAEFAQLPPVQQSQMLDMLAQTGFASREWWENFLRG